MAASDCNFEIQAEINVILNETCRSLKQQSSSPWPFMPEFRLLCSASLADALSFSALQPTCQALKLRAEKK